jgi:hypothetical protein
MLTIGLALTGALLGGCVGMWLGEREGGDYNFAPAVYGPIGALIGCFAGTVIGEAIS